MYEYDYEFEVEYDQPEVQYEVTVQVEEPMYEVEMDWGAEHEWQVDHQSSGLKIPWEGYLIQEGQQYDMYFENFQINADWSLWGSGADAIGEFTCYGTCDNNGKCEFTKEYIGQHSVYYRGQFNGKRIRGKWHIQGQQPEYFEIKMRPQVWQGAFFQDGEKYPMALDMMISEQGVWGSGCDEIGRFQCSGSVNGDTVKFEKRYLGQHSVRYHGHWDGQQIKGKWNIGSTGDCGRFQLHRSD